MKLDALSFDGSIRQNRPVKKLTVYPYDHSDVNEIEEAGLGPRTITVDGKVNGSTNRDALEQACESAGEKKLYFPSAQGQDNDRYYKVKTHPLVLTGVTASIYSFVMECICTDEHQYYEATDLVVW